MKTQKVTLAVSLLLSALALTACDKKDTKDTKAPQQASSSTSTTVTTSTTSTTSVTVPTSVASATATTVPISATATSANSTTAVTAAASTLTPMMEFWVTSTRLGVTYLLSQKYPKMTAEQKNCLASHDGDANYAKELDPVISHILTPEETAQANQFFGSDLGKKFLAMTNAQMMRSKNMPDMSQQEMQAIQAELKKPYMVKLEQKTSGTDPKVGKAILEKSMASEKARCKIA